MPKSRLKIDKVPGTLEAAQLPVTGVTADDVERGSITAETLSREHIVKLIDAFQEACEERGYRMERGPHDAMERAEAERDSLKQRLLDAILEL